MARRNRRASDPPPRPVGGGFARVEEHDDGDWKVASISGDRAIKVYRCPGCSQQIAAGVPHLVVWRTDAMVGGGEDMRRHWHTPCWNARSRRR